jgi:hypothetical protein
MGLSAWQRNRFPGCAVCQILNLRCKQREGEAQKGPPSPAAAFAGAFASQDLRFAKLSRNGRCLSRCYVEEFGQIVARHVGKAVALSG